MKTWAHSRAGAIPQRRRTIPVIWQAVFFLAAACMYAASGLAQEPASTAPAPKGGEREITVDALSVVKLVTKALPNAHSSQTLGEHREGTGVVIDSKGLVLTIGYLIVEAEQVELETARGRVVPATVVGVDNRSGIGLVRALAPLPIKPIDFGQSESANVRDLVLIVGFDGVAPAYVVSKRPFVGHWEYLLDEAIYTAPATVNWSGAALMSRDGKLLGIGSMVVSDAVGSSSNVAGNMFVPIDVLKPALGDFIANGKRTAPPRPWIGVNTQEVQGNLIVTRVSPDGPAAASGIRRGDIIVSVAGTEIKGQADFYTKLWARGRAGVEIPVDVVKGTHVIKHVVKSIDRDDYFRSRALY